MHRHSQSHNSIFRVRCNPAQSGLSVPLTALFFAFTFLLLTLAAQPAKGQSAVPPTATQAARMPQFAAKLAHPARAASTQNVSRVPQTTQQRASYKNPRDSRARRGWPLDNNDLYDNGPIDGNTDAWSINFGYIVADTFTAGSGGAQITGMSFGSWLYPGDVLQTVEVSITLSPFGGTSYFDQVVTFTQTGCVTDSGGFEVCTETASFSANVSAAGTYWVNLQNATVPNGDPVYWDENSGVSCTGAGCPSQAVENQLGTLPSESFTILGETSTTTWTYGDNYACPPPEEGWQDLHDVTSASSGVVLDQSGNLYGSTSAGDYEQGSLYKLALKAGRWFLTTLYSFVGGTNGSAPGNVILGTDRALYGSAAGGIQSCGGDGSQYCGVVFKANPGSNPCASAPCSWDETTLYEFSGNADAWGGTVTAFDAAGNLYGISQSGGANGQGAIFELSRSSQGWTETVIYSFLGMNDGAAPTSLLVGHDGMLYGTTQFGGAFGYGVVFRLISTPDGWLPSTLYSFTGDGAVDGYSPGGLIQDGSGDLLGFSTCYNTGEGYLSCGGGFDYDQYGLIFMLKPGGTVTGWSFTLLYNNVFDCNGYRNDYHALYLTSTGLYAAEGGADGWCGPDGCYVYYCGQFGPVGGSHYVLGNADIFQNLTVDANGNLYGTTQTCSFDTPFGTSGMVWKFSP